MITLQKTLGFILLLSISCASAEELSVDITPNVTREGEDVTITCYIEDATISTYIFFNKDQQGTIVQLATNDYLSGDVSNLGRYRAEAEEKDGGKTRIYRLLISGAVVADSGTIGCMMPATQKNASKKLVVTRPINPETLKLVSIIPDDDPDSSDVQQVYSYNQTVEFRTGAQNWFKCVVGGSYPSPDIKVLLGSKDITGDFLVDQEQIIPTDTGTAGFQDMKVLKTVVSQNPTVFKPEDKGQKLQCVVSVPQQQNATTHINVIVDMPPKIKCPKVQMAALYAEMVRVSCDVTGAPPINLTWVFQGKDGSNRTVTPGVPFGTNVVSLKEKSPESFAAILTIEKVFPEHFRDYLVVVKNQIGVSSAGVRLQEDKKGAVTGSGKHVAPSLTTLATLLLLLISKS